MGRRLILTLKYNMGTVRRLTMSHAQRNRLVSTKPREIPGTGVSEEDPP